MTKRRVGFGPEPVSLGFGAAESGLEEPPMIDQSSSDIQIRVAARTGDVWGTGTSAKDEAMMGRERRKSGIR